MGSWTFEKLALSGAYLVTPFVSKDERGAFIKDYSLDVLKRNGIDYPLSEVFYTVSKKGVVRALHFQKINHQPKLVRCLLGKIFDVIVDLRPESPTFKQWQGFFLSGNEPKELLVPEHFGHGYLVLEDSIVSYKCAAPFDASNDSGIIFDDPAIGIDWPFDLVGGRDNIILSEKDKTLPTFLQYEREGCL